MHQILCPPPPPPPNENYVPTPMICSLQCGDWALHGIQERKKYSNLSLSILKHTRQKLELMIAPYIYTAMVAVGDLSRESPSG